MARASTAHEPTMDEILASIRRMISDDEQPFAPGPHAVSQAKPAKVTKLFADDTHPAAFGEASDVADDNVIELAITRAMEDARLEVAAEAAEEAAIAKEADAAPGEAAAGEIPEPAPGSAVTAQGVAPASESPTETAPPSEGEPAPASTASAMPQADEAARGDAPLPLMSPHADAAVAGAFNRLAVSMLSRSSRTIDELVEDLLRPLLRNWLDNNLPPLVERLVREEIERVSRGRR